MRYILKLEYVQGHFITKEFRSLHETLEYITNEELNGHLMAVFRYTITQEVR
jgi:hypothetical protein